MRELMVISEYSLELPRRVSPKHRRDLDSSSMKPAEVKRVLDIVEDALELTGAELGEYLERVCGEDSLCAVKSLIICSTIPISRSSMGRRRTRSDPSVGRQLRFPIRISGRNCSRGNGGRR